MKISQKQLKETIRREIHNIVESKKYAMFEGIIRKCVNEAFDEPQDPRFSNYNSPDGWGDSTDIEDIEDDNSMSWDEYDKRRLNTDELGANADDIFNGRYEKGDHFQDSDFKHTQNYWVDDDGEFNHTGSLADIQRDRVNQAFDARLESIIREEIHRQIK